MKKAIREALSDARGKISRRAIVLYVLLGTFVSAVVVNLVNQKIVLNQTLEMHLYMMMALVLGSIFADPLMQKKKTDQEAPPPGNPPAA